MGRIGHPPLIIGATALVVAVAGIGAVVTHGDGPVTKAPTIVGQAARTVLIAPDGRARPTRAGDTVPDGYVVRTGSGGHATLLTRGRVVYLEGSAALSVQDGAREQLRTGDAVIDARNGPAMTLGLADDRLEVPAGSATEADRTVSTRVGSLHGAAVIVSPTGRRLSVPGLAEAELSGDALPATPSPLQLNDNWAEAGAATQLVAEDIALNGIAAGLNSSGPAAAGLIEAAWSGPPAPSSSGVSPGNEVLPMLLAQATTSGGGLATRYGDVLSWRRSAASWGVVLELLHGQVEKVESSLLALQDAGSDGGGTAAVGALGGSSLGRGAAGAPVVGSATSTHRSGGARHHAGTGGASGSTGGSAGTGSGSGSGGGSGSGSGAGSGSGGGSGTTPTPDPSPTSLLGTVVTTVTTVVGGVLSVLPTPAPSASSGGVLGLLGNGDGQ